MEHVTEVVKISKKRKNPDMLVFSSRTQRGVSDAELVVLYYTRQKCNCHALC